MSIKTVERESRNKSQEKKDNKKNCNYYKMTNNEEKYGHKRKKGEKIIFKQRHNRYNLQQTFYGEKSNQEHDNETLISEYSAT